MPLPWEPLAALDLPEAVEPFHIRDLGPECADLGLMKIVKNQRDLALVYDRILAAIAMEIKKAIAGPPPPPAATRPVWSTTKNAFLEPPPSRPASEDPILDGPPGGAAGPRHVHLVVAAGTADELRRGDDPTAYYGGRPTDWAPFAPDHPEPLVRAAAAVAIEQRMTPYPEELDDRIVDRLEAAQRDNELVLLLVDPRTVGMPAHAAALRAYDDRLYTITGVVVAWNVADAGSETLATAVRDMLPKKILFMGKAVHDSMRTVHEAVRTMEEFRRVVVGLLVFLQEIFLGRGHAVRAVVDGQAGSFSTVVGTVHR
jgi:FxsC-like protein